MIGSACAAVVCVATGTTANAIGVGGLPGILSIKPEYMGTFAICTVIAVVVPFVLTVIVGKKKLTDEQLYGETKEVEEAGEEAKEEVKKAVTLVSPMKGEVKPLSEVNDPAFAGGILGQGVAIIPSEGKLCAPVDATITSILMPSKHAVGLRTHDGMEMLMHIGLDTVKLEGKYFKAVAKEGQTVKKGDTIIEFDLDAVKQAGFDTITPILIINADDYKAITPVRMGEISIGQQLMKTE